MFKTSSAFYDFHMKDNFILPQDVLFMRDELNEKDNVLDFYSKNNDKRSLEKNYL